MHDWRPGDFIRCDASLATAPALETMPDGYVKGVASSPSTDLYGHQVRAHAFDASIRRKGLTGPGSIKLLLDHDSTKPAGVIKRLDTVNDALRIEAQLNLAVSYVRDRYEVAKQNDGLSFSVGFILEEFDLVEDKRATDGAFLVIKQGDLCEVSVVCFPAQVDATMELIKSAPFDDSFAALKAQIASAQRMIAALRGIYANG